MNINTKLIHKAARLPTKGSATAAGWDLYVADVGVEENNEFGFIEYDSGLAMEIPKGHAGFLFPRSSISKTGLILANSVGIIDSDYRGTIKGRFKHVPGTSLYRQGDRFAQLVIMPIPETELTEVKELSVTERGVAGFGSTGT